MVHLQALTVRLRPKHICFDYSASYLVWRLKVYASRGLYKSLRQQNAETAAVWHVLV